MKQIGTLSFFKYFLYMWILLTPILISISYLSSRIIPLLQGSTSIIVYISSVGLSLTIAIFQLKFFALEAQKKDLIKKNNFTKIPNFPESDNEFYIKDNVVYLIFDINKIVYSFPLQTNIENFLKCVHNVTK